MNTRLATRQIRLNEQAGIIKARKASGLTVDEYCKQHSISRSAYFYWLRCIKEEALSKADYKKIHLNKKTIDEQIRIDET